MTAQLNSYIDKATRTIESEASKVVRKTATSIEADIKADMASPKSGRVYKRKGKSHTASAAGEAPAIDTGGEVNSVTTVNDGLLATEVGSDKEQAGLLEMGTDEIKPRPAFEKAGKRAENTFRRNAQKIR